jgi:hypothetical protein
MSTNFPGSLDSYVTKSDNTDDVLAVHVNNLQDAVEAIEVKVGGTSSAVNTSLDYFLKNVSGAYRTHTHDGTSDDGAKIPMASLSEVAIVSLLNQQYLRYNSSSAKWENYTLSISLDSLSDVVITGTPATRSGIYFDGANWVNGYANAVYAA